MPLGRFRVFGWFLGIWRVVGGLFVFEAFQGFWGCLGLACWGLRFCWVLSSRVLYGCVGPLGGSRALLAFLVNLCKCNPWRFLCSLALARAPVSNPKAGGSPHVYGLGVR